MSNRIFLALIALSSVGLGACGEDGSSTSLPVEQVADGKADGLVATARFETFKGIDGKSYFHLIAANGQKVLQSQGYSSAQRATSGLASVRANGVLPEQYEMLEAVNGQTYFNLLAANGEIIGTSELYSTKSNAERAVNTSLSLVAEATKAAAPKNATFQVFKGLDSKYYFHLRAGNGEIVLQSQSYTKNATATSGIDSVLSNGATAARYQVKDAANGQAYFVLTASNGKTIATSETYVSRSNAQRGADAVVQLLSWAGQL
jgi:uncharacterized protein YegP (UPF0339 family)